VQGLPLVAEDEEAADEDDDAGRRGQQTEDVQTRDRASRPRTVPEYLMAQRFT